MCHVHGGLNSGWRRCRARLHMSMPLSLVLGALCITRVLPSTAATYESAGVASAGSVMFLGTLWHLTAGICLPALVAKYMESVERRHFLEELAPAARKAKSV